MFEIHELNEINSEIDLIFLNNIAKESALIGNEILIDIFYPYQLK